MFLAFARVLKLAAANFRRNLWLSLATVTIMVLAVLTFHLVVMLRFVTSSALTELEKKIDVAVYLAPSVSEESARTLVTKLTVLPEIAEIVLVSRAESLANFSAKRGNDPAIRRALLEVGESPFGVTLKIRARQTAEYPRIIAALEDPKLVPAGTIERKSYEDHQRLIARFRDLSEKAQRVVGFAGLSFLLMSFFVVFNTIRIAIYSHREEVGIMRLVGAGNWFIRMPFILEGVLLSALATVVGILLVFGALWWGQPHLLAFFAGVPIELIAFYRANALPIFAAQFLGLTIMNMLGAAIAIGRYLKV